MITLHTTKLERRVDSDLDFAFSYSTTETVLYNIQDCFSSEGSRLGIGRTHDDWI
jgi:hypothetical protein